MDAFEAPPDVDSLPPTEYLALETLAARHRLGERAWTFPAQPRIVAAVHALARRGLVDVKSGTAPKTILAWLTDAGRSAALRDGYEPPILRLIEASSLGTPEAKALRASVPDEVARKIVKRSKEIALEKVIREAWAAAADGCLNNMGHRKQDPCCGCVTAQLIGRVEPARVSAEERSDDPSKAPDLGEVS